MNIENLIIADLAAEQIHDRRDRRKLVESNLEPSKIQAVESKSVQPYMENANLPSNAGAKVREMEAKLSVKQEFVERLAKKFEEAVEIHDRILSAHSVNCKPGPDDCTESLDRLEEAYEKAHARYVKEYTEIGLLAKALYSREGR